MIQPTIKAIVQTGEESGYVAYCVDLPVVTQGQTNAQTIANLNEAVSLYVESEDDPI